MLAAFLAVSLSAQNWGGAHGWSCGGRIAFDGFEGGIARDYGRGVENEPYRIQVNPIGVDPNRRTIYWTIYPLAEGPPPARRADFLTGRREADAFRTGPDYVHIEFAWHTRVVGPIWAHYWGDGQYAGVEMLMSRWNVRRWTDREGLLGGISGGLASRPLLTVLAPARRWSVVAIDASGRQLFSESFDVPSWQAAEAEFRRMRAAIDRLETRFRASHDRLEAEGVTCVDIEDPIGSI